MSEEAPLVSVVMPAYNAADFIEESILSIINQTYKNWELIVINDGSTDDTLTIVKKLAKHNDRIRCVENKTNQGLIAGRNQGLLLSKGKYIAHLDSDDNALANRLQVQVDFLEKNKDYVFVGSACESIDKSGNRLGKIERIIPDEHLKTLLLFTNYFINSTVMLRASLAKQVQYAKEIPLAEDYNYFVLLSELGKMANLKESLVAYRTHEQNISHLKEAELQASVVNIQRRLLLTLGIEPTEKEAQIHTNLVEGDLLKKGISLQEAETWLMRLITANNKTTVYPNNFLNYYCAFFYRRACNKAGLGIKAVKTFKGSNLYQYLKKDFKGNSIFFVKSMLNRQ